MRRSVSDTQRIWGRWMAWDVLDKPCYSWWREGGSLLNDGNGDGEDENENENGDENGELG